MKAEPQARPVSADPSRPAAGVFRPALRGAWWLRNRRYSLYMLREFTAIPIALWLLWWLVEMAGLKSGPSGYKPLTSPLFVAFSVVCLVFAVLHSYTFLSLSGLIMRIPLGQRYVPPRLVAGGAFLAAILATVGVAYLLVRPAL